MSQLRSLVPYFKKFDFELVLKYKWSSSVANLQQDLPTYLVIIINLKSFEKVSQCFSRLVEAFK